MDEEADMKHHAGRWLLAGLGVALVAAVVGIAVAGSRRLLPLDLAVDAEPAVAVPQPQPIP
ncbi:hypothetical protein [Dactylosporangium matsuzakiense]|uniref:Uncharacterized protein n=1 Tax=Dactylosporangium matsuzakiense TaxID=53360 RepID=A0A9W6KM91_9ACTN|nr:hypothetical protein [Dactylosporangium matsuzakiense]GLL04621.1 hypothetical protein GCM10017581_063680 [Dactylosporangium matsuzakiense]